MFRLVLLFHILIFALGCATKDYRTASRVSAEIAPKAEELEEDVFQIYAARAFAWRGNFAVHTWIAWKLKDEKQYTVSQAIGWRLKRNLPVVKSEEDLPDRLWFDNEPRILQEIRGEKARKAILRTKEIIKDYPYKKEYRVWPGPNSNTFIAYIIRNNEYLKLELPPHAIGKDYLENGKILTSSPSATGFQFSLLGAFGLTLGLQEGIELNVLALNFGLDFYPLALKLPLVGRLGWPDKVLD